MLFSDLMESLIAVLRARVQNGEVTERGLARMVGVSQPHMHNVLKGARILSPELSDRVLQHLRLSVLDLLDLERIAARVNMGAAAAYDYVPVLRGRLGPACPWPTEISDTDRLPFLSAQTSAIPRPLAVRLAEDARMTRTFSAGDVALLDQSQRARTELEPNAHYAVRLGTSGVLRRLHVAGDSLFLIPDDSHERPNAWQKLPLDGKSLPQVVRARAYVVNPSQEWG
jgi:hypothetical protein